MSATKTTDTGGPAFPVPAGVTTFTGDPRDGAGYEPSWEGMTLRDHFAGLAMQGFASTQLSSEYGRDPDYWYDAALRSYCAADAMLAARTPTTGNDE